MSGETVLKRLILWTILAAVMAGAAPAQVLVMGDSLLAVNGLQGRSVADELQRLTPLQVVDRSVIGASYLHLLPISGAAGMRISAQYRRGPWQWVVLNGGGNDVLWHCGCGDCTKFLDRLITPDGRKGAIAKEVARLRRTGARVAFVGYLRSNGFESIVDKCAATGDEMDRRLGRMAAADPGVMFIPLADLVPEGDTSYYAQDRIHPSPKGSKAIAARIAKAIRR